MSGSVHPWCLTVFDGYLHISRNSSESSRGLLSFQPADLFYDLIGSYDYTFSIVHFYGCRCNIVDQFTISGQRETQITYRFPRGRLMRGRRSRWRRKFHTC